MVSQDRSAQRQYISEIRSLAFSLRRQLLIWLGLAPAGGAVAILSLASSLPDPDFALQQLVWSLAAFILAILFAGLAIWTTLNETSALEMYRTCAHDRDEIGDAVGKIPEVFSSPPKAAEKANAERNRLLSDGKSLAAQADKHWSHHTVWRRVSVVCATAAAVLFVAGCALPLLQIAFGSGLVPPSK